METWIMRRTAIFTLVAGGFMLAAQTAGAGAVGDQFGGGAFGLPWNAGKSAIEAKYPGGKWDQTDKGFARYCATSKQLLLKLPAQYQTQELCFLIGQDNTLASVTARMDATLPALLAIVNRSRTMFGDFDAVRRDEGAIQSRHTNMLWMKDAPLVVQVSSGNDPDGRPNEVSFTVSDEGSLYTAGAEKVSNKPTVNR
jgi:hypothetical protein